MTLKGQKGTLIYETLFHSISKRRRWAKSQIIIIFRSNLEVSRSLNHKNYRNYFITFPTRSLKLNLDSCVVITIK